MKKFFLVILLFVTLIADANAQMFDFRIKEGFVSYKVVAKTFGIIPDKIVGINSKIGGDISISDGRVVGRLIVPVIGFESGNTRRDKDVAKILKYNEHPDIIFELVEIGEEEVNKGLHMEKKAEVRLKGKLAVAGVSKVYDFVIKSVRINEGEIKLITKIESKFTDFGLKPPSFGGFIKSAPDQVFLSGEVVVEIKNQKGGEQ